MRPFQGWATGLLLLSAVLWTAPASACPGAEAPCRVADGDYYIRLSENDAAAVRPPLVVFLHGAGGHADEVVRGGAYLDPFLDAGYAVLAPQGLTREGRRGPNWSVRDGQTYSRDDTRFVAEVIEDAALRFGLDRDRVLLAGFSRGASLVWDIACHAPSLASAYAAISGGFWRPLPEGCEGPVRLFHTHGFTDRTVPLEGRLLRDGRTAQADIYAGLQIWRMTDDCGSRADWQDASGPYWRKAWTACADGTLELALHAGGHEIPAGWARMIIDWYEGRPPATN